MCEPLILSSERIVASDAGIRRVEPWLRADDVPAALLLIACASVLACMPPQNDTWWLLRSGEEMWKNGGFLLAERFSHTAFGSPLYNHEWITQLLFYSWFRTGGPVLLTLACAVFALASICGAWLMMRNSAEWGLGALAVLVVCVAPMWSIRPQVISAAFFVFALHLTTTNRLAWLPVVCVLWGNVHGMVLLGVVIAGCAFLESLIWSKPRLRASGVIAIACAIAPMASPLGWHYWPRVWDTVVISRALGIQEYRAAFELNQAPFWIAALTLGALAVVRRTQWLRGDRDTRVLLFVSSALAVAAAMSVRNIPFFMLVAIPTLSRFTKSERRERTPAPGPEVLFLVGAAVVVAAAVAAYRWRDGGKFLGWSPMSRAAAAAIASCNGPLFNGFEDGGPIVWFVHGRKVFVNSQVEAYPRSLLARSRLADVEGAYKSLFADYAISCAAVSSGSVMSRRLAADTDATQIYADAQWTVFEMRSPFRTRVDASLRRARQPN